MTEAKKRRKKLQKQKKWEKKQLQKEADAGHMVSMSVILNKMFYKNTGSIYIIHCGKTGSGKTYNALMALKNAKTGVYLAPLRLLAWEVYDNLNSDGYSCSLVTGEEVLINQDSKYTASTIEMADFSCSYDVAVIDESFMIGDVSRGKSWTKAILDINASQIHIIVNPEGLTVIEKLLKYTSRKYEVKHYKPLQEFRIADEPHYMSRIPQKGGVFVTFSRVGAFVAKMRFQEMGVNAGILYGSLPPEVKKIQIQKFIDGYYDVMVSTDVIGMGVNLPCNYIVFLSVEKYDGISSRLLHPTEIRQISGRTGRYGISGNDCYVSADSSYNLKYIRRGFDMPDDVKKAYVGLDWEMFSSFPENMSIGERVLTFGRVDFISEKLKEFVVKESISRYLDIIELVDRPQFSLQVKWILLNAPVKENNRKYFCDLINGYVHKGFMYAPQMGILYDIKEYEDKISEIELYLNLSRSLNHDVDEKRYILEEKEKLVEKLMELLLDKKLSVKKKCKLCTTMLELTYPYGYCQSCYYGKVASGYANGYDY